MQRETTITPTYTTDTRHALGRIHHRRKSTTCPDTVISKPSFSPLAFALPNMLVTR